MIAVCRELEKKIQENPYYHRQIKYNRYWWYNYFHVDVTEKHPNAYSENNDPGYRLYKDLPPFIDMLEKVKEDGFEYVTLHNG